MFNVLATSALVLASKSLNGHSPLALRVWCDIRHANALGCLYPAPSDDALDVLDALDELHSFGEIDQDPDGFGWFTYPTDPEFDSARLRTC